MMFMMITMFKRGEYGGLFSNNTVLFPIPDGEQHETITRNLVLSDNREQRTKRRRTSICRVEQCEEINVSNARNKKESNQSINRNEREKD